LKEDLDKLAELESELKAGGGEKSIQKQHDSGKLTAPFQQFRHG
jgi:acetyl-CoA carboxylase carboxyltransferase component